MVKRLVKRFVPARLRFQLYRVRRLGLARALEYARLERRERRKSPPRAGRPFDVGGIEPIVLDETTVHSVNAHWVGYGHAIKELHAFRRLSSGHRCLLDIGAAEGIFSAAFCALTGGEAKAFEPSPEMYDRLAKLCSANPGFRIEAFDIALGDAAGELAVRQYEDGQFSHVAEAEGAIDTMTVQTLDALVAERGFEPDMAKIDVEGMEIDVLRGGTATFRESVRTILLEVHWAILEQRGQSVDELETLLRDLGFRILSLEFAPIDDLSRHAERYPELIPGYTIVVCCK